MSAGNDAAYADAGATDSDPGGSCSEPEPTPAPSHFDSSASTLEVSNARGRRRRRSPAKKGKGRRELRTKFQIEGLYVEISELRRQNEVLKHILESVRGAGAPGGVPQQVPRTVQISDSDRSGSDLELSASDRMACDEGGKGGEGEKEDDAAGDTDEMQMEMQRVFHSLVLDKSTSSGA